MFEQSPSQIFKAQFRGHHENEEYRCLSTFNFDTYFDKNREAFGLLNVFNDETLAPQKAKSFTVAEDSEIVLIPLVGALNIDGKDFVKTEGFQILKMKKGSTFELQNPYEKELINYLQIRFSGSHFSQNDTAGYTFSFQKQDELLPLYEGKNYRISIGIFSARSEAAYSLQDVQNGLFAFVIAGAFEFENRLLESRDALSISEINQIELESLTENAILLLIETPLQH